MAQGIFKEFPSENTLWVLLTSFQLFCFTHTSYQQSYYQAQAQQIICIEYYCQDFHPPPFIMFIILSGRMGFAIQMLSVPPGT